MYIYNLYHFVGTGGTGIVIVGKIGNLAICDLIGRKWS